VHDGANRHGSKLLEPTVDSIPIERPAPSEKYPHKVSAWIAAMTTTACITSLSRGLIPHIRMRGEEFKLKMARATLGSRSLPLVAEPQPWPAHPFV
jgi:hypothetical protein